MAIRGLFETENNLNLQPPGSRPLVATQNLNLQPTGVKPQVPGTFTSSLGPILGGLQAGQGVGAPTDPLEAGVGIATATGTGLLSGALTGAAVGAAGGPIGAGAGALIGGGAALLTSALNAWLSVRSENKRKKETQKLIKELEAKRAKELAQNRKDSLMQLQFNRKDIERNQAISAAQSKRQLLMDMINNNQTLKDRFIQTGVR